MCSIFTSNRELRPENGEISSDLYCTKKLKSLIKLKVTGSSNHPEIVTKRSTSGLLVITK